MIGAALGVLLFTDGFHKPTLDNCIPLALMGLFATGGMLAATRAWMGGNMLLAACLGFSAIPFSELIGIVLFGQYTVSAVNSRYDMRLHCRNVRDSLYQKRRETA